MPLPAFLSLINLSLVYQALAEYKLKLEEFTKKLNELQKRMAFDQEFFNYLVALVALGITTANADGIIHIKQHARIILKIFNCFNYSFT